MLARLTATKQWTLPDKLLASFPGVDCFSASEENRRIVLVPLPLSCADAVRQKLGELDIGEEDIKNAVTRRELDSASRDVSCAGVGRSG